MICCAYDVVTGLHDIDEYIQAQLLLAVSSAYGVICFLVNNVVKYFTGSVIQCHVCLF